MTKKIELLKYAWVWILCLTLNSCFNNSIKFEVQINSKKIISDVRLMTSNKVAITNVNLNEDNNSIVTLDMNSIPKTDGNYIIEFKRDKIKQSKSFGYYTNGYPIVDLYRIIITDSDVEISEINKS